MPPDIQSFDLFWSSAMRSLQNAPLDLVVHLLTTVTYGGALWVILAIILWRRGYKLLALQMAVAIVFGLAESSILKHIFHRARPSVVDLVPFWMPMHQFFADSYSFPSGHTVLSFAAAGVVFLKFRDWRGWLALLLALIVGICRIYEGLHWPTDVFVGIFVGLSASYVGVLLAPQLVKSLGGLVVEKHSGTSQLCCEQTADFPDAKINLKLRIFLHGLNRFEKRK